MIQITLPKPIESKVIEYAKQKKISLDSIILEALEKFFTQDAFSDLKQWDVLSDEALVNFEKEFL